MRENVAAGMRTMLAELALQASVTLGDETLEDIWPGLLDRVGPGQALRHALLRWSTADPRPLVLLIDEIDALVGDTLLAVLRQLRTSTVRRASRTASSCAGCATCATTASTRRPRTALLDVEGADRVVPGVLPGALRELGAALRALPRARGSSGSTRWGAGARTC